MRCCTKRASQLRDLDCTRGRPWAGHIHRRAHRDQRGPGTRVRCRSQDRAGFGSGSVSAARRAGWTHRPTSAWWRAWMHAWARCTGRSSSVGRWSGDRSLAGATQPAAKKSRCTAPGWIAVGTGWAAYPQILERSGEQGAPPADHPWRRCCRAPQEIARLAARGWREGAGVAPEEALPVYLRDRVTHNVSQKT